MLYSQALMVMAYNDFCRIKVPDQDEEKLAVNKKYKKIIYQTLDFVKQEMRSPQGGYYSALDADSERIDTKGRNKGEHAEGAYYLWLETELKQLLSKDEFDFVKRYFNVSDQGNIFSDPQNEFAGLNIFYIDEEYRDQTLSKQQEDWLVSVKVKLNAQRRLRPRPHLDDKVIAAWNGMLLSAFAQASIVFDDKALLVDAIQILQYVKKYLYSSDSKKLYRQYRDRSNNDMGNDAVSNNDIGNNDIANSRGLQNDERIEAILTDYVWLVDGLLHVYESGNDKQWLDWAMVLQKKQDDLFLDSTTGAYFEATGNDTHLLFRSKSIFDGALPSANAIALSNLRRFSVLLKKQSNKKEFSNQANKLVSSFATAVNQNPAAAAMFLAVEFKHYHLNQKIEK
jgi:uncharacterized protein YyaL (SSP411 family)